MDIDKRNSDFEKVEVIIVDDEEVILDSLSRFLKLKNWIIKTTQHPHEVLNILQNGFGDIVISDINMPEMTGIELTRKIKNEFPFIEVIIITGYNTKQNVIDALKAGAADYFAKPIDMDDINAALYRCSRLNTLKEKNLRLNSVQKRTYKDIENIMYLGNSDISKTLKRNMELIITQPLLTVLIQGESGVGKELCARYIHSKGFYSNEPFVAVNCASFPESLIERELFGHEKGSFTDAKEMMPGVFEMAGQGTVLLDEIGEMPLSAQNRLLRVIESKSFRRLGGKKEIKLKCRIIAATNRNLEKMVEEKTFRLDLYYRINVFPIYIPALRERLNELPELINHISNNFKKEYKKLKDFQLSEEAMNSLKNYNFPGNIRELNHIIYRLYICEKKNEISGNNLNYLIKNKKFSSSENLNIIQNEKILICKALEKCNNDNNKAADLLGIGYDGLLRRIKKYGIK